MPRKKTPCARRPGHKGDCRTAEGLADSRERLTQRRRGVRRSDDPVAVRRWRANARLARYGLAQETFDALLKAQGHACGMCREPFTEDQLIFVDHDHNLGCHPEEKRACDKCRRGLLCLGCNTALGHIERKYDLARAYLDRISVVPVV
jgi:Recombination endonuclease VII